MRNKSLSFHWNQGERNQTPPLYERYQSFMLSLLNIWISISCFLKFLLFFVKCIIVSLNFSIKPHFRFPTSSFWLYFKKKILYIGCVERDCSSQNCKTVVSKYDSGRISKIFSGVCKVKTTFLIIPSYYNVMLILSRIYSGVVQLYITNNFTIKRYFFQKKNVKSWLSFGYKMIVCLSFDSTL